MSSIQRLSVALITIFLAVPAWAAAPTLFFSDLIDGPKSGWEGSAARGAAVTIWGKNLGSSRDSSYVTVGGVSLANDSDYAEWGATANNARGLERITFWLNSNMTNGAGTISVVVNGTPSNTLPFYVRNTGNIYFVDDNGNNSHNGRYASSQGGSNGPWQTIGQARQRISGGDLLYVRAGTYSDGDLYSSILYLDIPYNGAANNYTAYVGYPAEFPTLDGVANGGSGVIRNNYRDTGYTVISKMRIIPPGSAVRVQASSIGHYRVIGLEIDGLDTYPISEAAMEGAIDPHDISDITIYGNRAHDWGGSKYDHGIYVGANDNGSILRNYDIAWNEFHDLNKDASGIYIHPKDTDPDNGYADEIDIHDNINHDLQHAGIHIASRVQDVRIWNNVVYNAGSNSGRGCYQITVSNAVASNIKFYNNVAYSATSNLDGSALIIIGYYTNVELKNNIFYSLNNSPYIEFSNAWWPALFSSDHDLFYGNGAPLSYGTNDYTPQNYLNSDPQFYNAAGKDFHLQANSPAIGAGVTINWLTTDLDGVPRPQASNSQFAIGAYEYDVGYVPPPSPPPGPSEPPLPPGPPTPQPPAAPQVSLSLPHWVARNATIPVSVTGAYDTITWSFSANPAVSSPGNPGGGRASAGGTFYSISTRSPALDLDGVSGLSLGSWHVTVTASNGSAVSSPAEGDVTLVTSDLAAARVYPNPWRSDRHQGKTVIFDQLTLNSTVKIFTASGHLVRSLDGSSGSASWDLKNDSGDAVASGVYLYLITNDQGQKSRGKVAVIK